ncbi:MULTISPECIES: immunity protein YezG family protein [Bacillus cereus group]|uniref:immunity protein YezG family protein n=1 Tax=Bacillus cereus group TaxID=86661 RepID=UPI0008640499|nr:MULTISPECIES: immunity protein YezG family protein [Bacillus cereus group]AWC30837.1 TIGR01741 family protein [Bacillus cytotoxicus]AWC42918.1 TIGR01741 family protein [Bacillus cytotoxicus]AWC50849.1 TIGR01741 family protein [Bacillus cytotoxicus]AWC54964.1 TIGR01741 family protein [Bacillus cytotoxicus]AWC59084.1 TIGR01741 family protein [Bacillus cytotoxicus]
MEKEMNQIYREIAETVNEMIPEEWRKFYFYAQISETGGGTYFFYNTLEDEQSYKYSLEIPYEYEIDKEYYKLKDRTLFELSDKLRKVFKDNQQELWYSFTLSLDSNGKLNVHYDYTNWFDTDYSFDDQLVIWEHKYLGTEPDDSESKDLISRYLDEYPNNPI